MKYFLKKLITLIITLLIVSLLAFLAFQIIPGDPTTKILGTSATPENVAALRARMGLDRPMMVRYFSWLANALRGNFGTSYSYNQSVNSMIGEKLPTTLLLTMMSFAITVVLSIPLGILAGSVRNRAVDRIITAVDQVLMSVPAFFLGILACYFFGLVLRVFTPGSFVPITRSPGACLAYLFFPAFSIAIPRIAMTVKLLRGSILNEMDLDYVRTSRSRGNGRSESLRRHVLRNALIPVITFLGISMAEIMTGTIVVEQVFNVPGIGRLLLNSIGNRDYPVVQAVVVILAAWIVVVYFLADLLNQAVDPRLRLE